MKSCQRASDGSTDERVRYEDVEEAVAVEVELEQGGHRLPWGDSELAVAVGAAGHIDTVAQQVECPHDHVLRVPREAQVEVARQDLLLHVEEVLDQLREDHPLRRAGESAVDTDSSLPAGGRC